VLFQNDLVKNFRYSFLFEFRIPISIRIRDSYDDKPEYQSEFVIWGQIRKTHGISLSRSVQASSIITLYISIRIEALDRERNVLCACVLN
jgi:Tfp pilus assembly protein PilO